MPGRQAVGLSLRTTCDSHRVEATHLGTFYPRAIFRHAEEAQKLNVREKKVIQDSSHARLVRGEAAKKEQQLDRGGKKKTLGHNNLAN